MRSLGTNTFSERSFTGTRTQVDEVKARYPNQLDYEGIFCDTLEFAPLHTVRQRKISQNDYRPFFVRDKSGRRVRGDCVGGRISRGGGRGV